MKFGPVLLALLCLVGCSTEPSAEPSREATSGELKQRAGDDGWQPLGQNLWRSASGEIAFRAHAATERGIAPDRFLTELEDGAALRDVLDLETFQHLGSSYFYRDKNHVYLHYTMADGGRFWSLESADASTFQATGCYGRDKSAIYTERGAVVQADHASFHTTEDAGCFAKDKNGYYYWGDRVEPENDEALTEAMRKLGPLEK